MKKYLSFIFSMCLIICCVTPAFATEDLTVIEGKYQISNVEVEFDPDAPVVSEINAGSASTNGWGGTPAQVTEIELWDFYVDEVNDDNVILQLKVTGYGKDHNRAFLNNNSVSSREIGYFINYGTTADGFYYEYNFGPLVVGHYVFKTTFRSTSYPYSEKSFQCSFDMTYVEN